jgi:hypothetical protein
MMNGEIEAGVGVGVGAGVDVAFGAGVSVHGTVVTVLMTEVSSAMRSGDAPQAVSTTQARIRMVYFILTSVFLNRSHAWIDLNLEMFEIPR